MTGFPVQVWDSIPKEARPLIVLGILVVCIVALFIWALSGDDDYTSFSPRL